MKSSTIKRIAFTSLCFTCCLLIFLQNPTENHLDETTKAHSKQLSTKNPNSRKTEQPEAYEQEEQFSDQVEQEPQSNERHKEPISLFEAKKVLSNQMIDQLARSVYANLPNSTQLLNLSNVSYLIEPQQGQVNCDPDHNDLLQKQHRPKLSPQSGERLLIVVNSKWKNFERRSEMRRKWLNRGYLCAYLNRFKQKSTTSGAQLQLHRRSQINRIEFVFVLAVPERRRGNERPIRMQIEPTVAAESQTHKDLLVINLFEHYRSMSLKHLAIFKWILGRRQERATESSSNNTLILKCDDDAQVDLGHLLDFYHASHLSRRRSSNVSRKEKIIESSVPVIPDREERNWIMCARFPENTRVLRSPKRKWRLSRAEYHFDTFPAYCSGLAYLAPVHLVRRLLVLAHVLLWNELKHVYDEPLWVDDVFITGILMASLAEQPEVARLNAHFCYTRAQQSRRKQINAPCMVSEISLPQREESSTTTSTTTTTTTTTHLYQASLHLDGVQADQRTGQQVSVEADAAHFVRLPAKPEQVLESSLDWFANETNQAFRFL